MQSTVLEKNFAVQIEGIDLKSLDDKELAEVKQLWMENKVAIFPDQELEDDDMILDIGPQTAMNFAGIVGTIKTILWNGPLGVFEYDQFSQGTRVLAQAIADNPGYSIAGGGETIAAIDKFAVTDAISYISTGGGAFLEYVQGAVLPAVQILEQRAAED